MSKLLYIQISENIMELIISGELQAGDKIDSVRDMAFKLKVNPKTIQKAFENLEDKEIFNVIKGEGRFITEDSKIIEKLKEELIEQEIKSFLEKMKKYNCPKKEILKYMEGADYE